MLTLALIRPNVGSLVQLLFVVVALGLLAWWLSTFEIPAPFKTGIYVICALILLSLVAAAFGVW